MAEKKKQVKKEGMTMMNFAQQQQANVDSRARSIQEKSKTGNLSNDGTGKIWNYNVGAAQ